MRSEVGDALPITLRIAGYERVAGGRAIFETAQVAPQLVAAGVEPQKFFKFKRTAKLAVPPTGYRAA